jgi:hypothetical protein
MSSPLPQCYKKLLVYLKLQDFMFLYQWQEHQQHIVEANQTVGRFHPFIGHEGP